MYSYSYKRLRDGSGKRKRAADVFHQCPACKSPNVIKFEGDVICGYCDWNSVGLSVEARMASQQAKAGNGSFGELVSLSTIADPLETVPA